MHEELKKMIIEEAAQKIREILPQMIREIAQRRMREYQRDRETLKFEPWDKRGNDYY
jgi:hypothetical protein